MMSVHAYMGFCRVLVVAHKVTHSSDGLKRVGICTWYCWNVLPWLQMLGEVLLACKARALRAHTNVIVRMRRHCTCLLKETSSVGLCHRPGVIGLRSVLPLDFWVARPCLAYNMHHATWPEWCVIVFALLSFPILLYFAIHWRYQTPSLSCTCLVHHELEMLWYNC